MLATLTIPAGFVVDDAGREALTTIVRQAGVVLNSAVVEALNAIPVNAAAERDWSGTVALGRQVIHGRRASLQWTIDEERANVAQSYYERSPYVSITPGMVLGRMTAATPGTDGVDVRGQTISARPGAVCPILLRDSIETRSDGTVVAKAGGLLVRSAAEAWIGNVLEIPGSVDFSTGNIDFDGDVVIEGGVQDGFSVRATGNLLVDGQVGASRVQCGGDLVARYGAAGAMAGEVNVGGMLAARYLEGVRGVVGGDLCIERDIVDCELDVEGGCRCGTAALIGGRITIAAAAAFRVIGSPYGARTIVALGALRSAEDRIKATSDALVRTANELRQTKDEYAVLKSRGRTVSDEQRERLTFLHFRVNELSGQRDVWRMAVEENRRLCEEKCDAALSVATRVFEKTVLQIDGAEYVIRNDLVGPLKITSRLGQAMIAFGEGASHPLGAMLRRVA